MCGRNWGKCGSSDIRQECWRCTLKSVRYITQMSLVGGTNEFGRIGADSAGAFASSHGGQMEIIADGG